MKEWLFIVPMLLSQWTPVPMDSRPLPSFTSASDEWKITTQGNAGGYALVLTGKRPIAESKIKLSWQWSATKFPSSHPRLPFDKDNDDYALRVGVLISDGGKSMDVPNSITELLKKNQVGVSYVVFYCAVPSGMPIAPCGVSPYHSRIIYCPREASSNYRSVTATPVNDVAEYFHLSKEMRQKLVISGLWIFADSDNSHSSSEAMIRKIKLVK